MTVDLIYYSPYGLIAVSLVALIIAVFSKSYRDELDKLGGICIVLAIVFISNNAYIYLFGIFIIGTLVTGNKYMLDLVKELRTKTTNQNVIYYEKVQSTFSDINTINELSKK